MTFKDQFRKLLLSTALALSLPATLLPQPAEAQQPLQPGTAMEDGTIYIGTCTKKHEKRPAHGTATCKAGTQVYAALHDVFNDKGERMRTPDSLKFQEMCRTFKIGGHTDWQVSTTHHLNMMMEVRDKGALAGTFAGVEYEPHQSMSMQNQYVRSDRNIGFHTLTASTARCTREVKPGEQGPRIKQ